jgi:hypothetical protein
MASCVLSTSKRFQYLKTTCLAASCYEEKTHSEVGVFDRRFRDGRIATTTTGEVADFGRKTSKFDIR